MVYGTNPIAITVRPSKLKSANIAMPIVSVTSDVPNSPPPIFNLLLYFKYS